MSGTRATLRWLVVMLALSLVAAACGANGEEAAPEDAEADPEEEPAPDAAEEEPTGEEPDGDEAAAWEPTENVRYIVPFSPGGGYDAYSRKIAEVAPNYLPDGVRIDIENVTGAAGRVGAEDLRSAEPDGHTIGIVHNINLAVDQIQSGEDATLDVEEDFEWIAGVTDEPYVLFSTTQSGIESLDDLEAWDDTIRMGAVGAASPPFVIGVIMSDIFGLAMDFVTAYPGAGEALTGATRGDFEIGAFEESSIYSFVESGDLVPLLVFGDEPSALFPDVPTVQDIDQTDAVILSVRPVGAPVGTDQEVIDYWADILEQTLSDPEFESWSEETGREAAFSGPEEVRDRISGALRFMQQYEDRIQEEFERVEG